MSSKIFLLVCLFLAFASLIVSDVAVARELAETSAESLNNEVNSAKTVGESKYPNDDYVGRGQVGPPSYVSPGQCNYGCCEQGNYVGGCRCCSYAGEAVDAEPQTQP